MKMLLWLFLLAKTDLFVYMVYVRSRGPPFQVLDEARDGVLCLDVNAYEIATGSADGNVRRYDIREGRLFVDFVKDPVTSVNLTADNQCLLVATMGSGVIRLFEKCNGQLLASYKGHHNRDFRIEAGILASNNEVLTGSEDGKVYIWDLVESTLIAKLEHPAGFKFVPHFQHTQKTLVFLLLLVKRFFFGNVQNRIRGWRGNYNNMLTLRFYLFSQALFSDYNF
uniref:WD repeat domain-containing protein 83 n=1 Tax=Meloidogyne enterolobii TaxID=390850 RepID=A0A6V7UMB8_MELEN|nr:unnamed protein product [Meloidogyne enterolobii]